jgi:hypothetical protein
LSIRFKGKITDQFRFYIKLPYFPNLDIEEPLTQTPSVIKKKAKKERKKNQKTFAGKP